MSACSGTPSCCKDVDFHGVPVDACKPLHQFHLDHRLDHAAQA